MNLLRLIFILMFVVTSHSQKHTSHDTDSHGRNFVNYVPLIIPFLLSAIFRSYITKYNIRIPYTVFILISGYLWGISGLYSKPISKSIETIHSFPVFIFTLYVPVLIFKTVLSLDVYTFLRSTVQILIISIPVTLLMSFLTGIIMRFIIDDTWSFSFATCFGALCTVIYSKQAVFLLKDAVLHMRHVSMLLEGECIFGLFMVSVIVGLIWGNHKGFIIHWYQFTMITLRIVILGTILGLIVGKVILFLIRKTYSHTFTPILLISAIPFCLFYIMQDLLFTTATFSLILAGLIISSQRTIFLPETEHFLINIWEFLLALSKTAICFYASVQASYYIMPQMSLEDHIFVILTYIVTYTTRFICFFLFSPILSRTGFGLTMKNMIICCWGGLKNPYSFILVWMYYDLATPKQWNILFLHIYYLHFLSILINGSCISLMLKFMGLSDISVTRKINMNNCIKHVLEKREKTTFILKLDRFLADANWDIIREATHMKHPYKINLNAAKEDNEFFMGYRFTYCSECKKNVIGEPTSKELEEMRREAKIRILKAKKISYARQFINGMISSEGLRILNQTVEMAMDTEEGVVKLDGLYKRFHDEGCFYQFVRRQLYHITHEKDRIRPPQTYWRRICYRFVISFMYDIVFLTIVFLNTIVIIIDLLKHARWDKKTVGHKNNFYFIILILNAVFCLLFSIAFVVKIMGYSRKSIRNGFVTYFKSWWNSFHFVMLCGSITNSVFDFIIYFHSDRTPLENIVIPMNFFRILPLLRLLITFKVLYPCIIRILDNKANSNMAFTYELGKGYVTSDTETLEMLPHIIDHDEIREEMKQKIENDRSSITKLLGLIQKERPWIAITVKTKQIIRTTINSMKDALNHLRLTGWIDDYEQSKLEKAINQLRKNVNLIKSIQPSPPKVIFKEVLWMADDTDVINFLFENVTVKTFDPGDVVFHEGQVADGVYIVVTGLFEVSYKPSEHVLNSLKEYGHLPIVDYISINEYNEPFVDYIVSGNSIGELSTLTDRSYNCRITASTHCQVYVLSHGIIKRAMEINSDPITGLECRIWKSVSIRIAIPLLLATPAYHAFSQDEVKYALERAFMPDLSNFKSFEVTEMIEDILLIEGIVADFNTRQNYIAPCYIPRTVQKLILPKSSLLKIPINIETKLLIIPAKDVDEYDVMINAEETCEMVVANASYKCLQHLIQTRSLKSRHRRKITNGLLQRRHSSRLKSSSQTDSSNPESETYFNKNVPTEEIQTIYSSATNPSLEFSDTDENERRLFKYKNQQN